MKNTSFWEEEISLQTLIQEIQVEVPNATLWDVFTSYEPIYMDNNPITRKENLDEIKAFCDKLIATYFPAEMTATDIDDFLIELDALINQDTSEVENEIWHELALKIIKENKTVVDQFSQDECIVFVDTLDGLLFEKNKASIHKQTLDDATVVWKSQGLSDVQIVALQNQLNEEERQGQLDLMRQQEKREQFYIEETESNPNDYVWPYFELATSVMFFGNESEEFLENETQYVQEKFESYRNGISKLLNQEPNPQLQPKLDYSQLNATPALENAYWKLMETHPFIHEFENLFSAWEQDGKVMFLSVQKEDKELPYAINLGGLALEKYKEILKQYNHLK